MLFDDKCVEKCVNKLNKLDRPGVKLAMNNLRDNSTGLIIISSQGEN